MNLKKTVLFLLTILLLFNSFDLWTQGKKISKDPVLKPQEKLVVLWTSGNRDTAIKMVFMYTFNSKKFKWWKDITLIVWGPSAKLLSEDNELQDYMKKIINSGITVKACKACSDMYGVSKKLSEIGVIVKYMGVELTNFIKEGRHILTL